MPTIECLKCHKTLTMDMQSIEQLQLCPFCMGKLREESSFYEIDTFGKVIYQSVKRGKDEGGNPRVIKGILMDDTPKSFETELNRFKRIFGNDQHFNTVLNAFDLETSAAEREFNKLAMTLIDVEGYNANWVEEIMGYCREAARYYHGENLQVKLNYIIQGEETGKSQNGKLSATEIKAIDDEAQKLYKTKDYAKAFELYQKTAEQGDSQAQIMLGTMYVSGLGVKKDLQKAIEYLLKVAEKGYDRPQYYMGRLYEAGKGVRKDYAKACEWYRKAAEQGHADAQFLLGRMCEKGNGVPQDFAKAFEWYRKAAEQGHAKAQLWTGLYYKTGAKGTVSKDLFEAYKWYQKAADQGIREAKEEIDRLKKENL